MVSKLKRETGHDLMNPRLFTEHQVNLFKSSGEVTKINSSSINGLEGVYLSTNINELNELHSTPKGVMSISVPNEKGDGAYILDMIKLPSKAFPVKNSKDIYVQGIDMGIHYQGIVRGLKNSSVAISLYKNGHVMGLISHKKANLVIGEEKNSKRLILYKDQKIISKLPFNCKTDERVLPETDLTPFQSTIASEDAECKVIRAYFECDNDLYNRKSSSIPLTIEYMTGLFNQVQILYANDGLTMEISEIKVWDTIDPYASLNSTSLVVNSFSNNLNGNYNGDLAHFISGRISSLGGGIAYSIPLELCNKKEQVCVSAVYDYFYDVPTYSWTVMVVTHEMGHILGSRHTHWCGWVGGPIDGCSGFAEADSSGYGCPTGPIPAEGGTIMSYCHTNTVGTNLSLGFGPQPTAVISRKVSSAECIATGGTAQVPSALSIINTKMREAELQWDNISDSSYYTVQYKKLIDNTWSHSIQTENNYIVIDKLSPNTTYEWRVKDYCSSYSLSSNFKTENNEAYFTESIPDTLCLGEYFILKYTASNFDESNNINVELSDKNGSFISPIVIGTASSDTSGLISLNIPETLDLKGSYKLRLVCSNPYFIGKESEPVKLKDSNTMSFFNLKLEYPKSKGFRMWSSSSDSGNTAYYIVDYQGLQIPTSLQIKNGMNAYNETAVLSGSFVIPSDSLEFTKILYGLSPGTKYSVFVSIDSSVYGCTKPVIVKNITTNGSSVLISQTHCIPDVDCSDDDFIDDFSIPKINLYNTNSGCSTGGFSSIDDKSYTVREGETYDFTLKTSLLWNEYLAIWLDSNNDGVFEPSEKIYHSPDRDVIFSSNFTIPESISTNGFYRMRVKLSYYIENQLDPCNSVFGEVEDYIFYIKESCHPEITLTSPLNDQLAGHGEVFSAANITSESTVDNISASDYFGKESIELLPGFKIESGGIFRAQIVEDCIN
ncbi:M12 family metallo-peptidase [Jiulongibacter sp. NS-SX5]|uniref:M12 family metallo-peptidase n=1 Tax=Jiulongibacter sp. NS-SX5 TaxID=3463854 RepID=UPI0040580A14